MENLNIALIGCGMIGREHIERIQNRIRNARIVAVCDVFEEGAKKGAEIAGAGTKVYTDFNEAINDPDVNAVVVTTPGQFHKGPVLAAIKAGKPVFSEKPLANTKWTEIFLISTISRFYRVTGEYIATDRAENLNVDKVIQLMVGREVNNMFPKVECPIGETILKVENLSAGRARLKMFRLNCIVVKFWYGGSGRCGPHRDGGSNLRHAPYDRRQNL